MEKVDLTKAAGFQAVDSEGKVLGTVSMEQLTDSIASKLAAELSAQNSATPVMRTMSAATTMAAATSTGSDKMETAFSETTDPAYVRVIDKNGNSAKQGISSLASVVGGLIGTVSSLKNGLATTNMYNSTGYSAYDSTGTYNLGRYYGFILGGRDGVSGVYFVRGTYVYQLSKASSISFYSDKESNVYATTLTGFDINLIPISSNMRPKALSEFNAEGYTLIEPMKIIMNS